MNALFDSLEARKLLAGITASLVNGKLTVTGTDAADAIYFDLANLPAGPGQEAQAGLGVFKADPDSGADPIAVFDQAKITSVLVDARGGNDTVMLDLYVLSEGDVPVTILGGGGNDTVSDSRFGNGSLTRIDGGSGDDVLEGGDTIIGGVGNDDIRGTVWDNHGPGPAFGSVGHFDGGDGRDTIHGSDADTITGGAGDDLIYNGAVVDAGAGYDTVYTAVNSVVRLGADNDKHFIEYAAYDSDLSDNVYLVGPTSIISYGQDGNDVVQVVDADGPLIRAGILKVYGGAGNDTLTGGRGNDSLNGESGHDKLVGGDGNDVLNGGTGNDALYGDKGNDDLFGSDGNDTLYGGAGNNRLYGQAGTDKLFAKNGAIDRLYDTKSDIVDRDSNDVLV